MGSNNLFGFYRGIVLDNRDPEINISGNSYGRVKVFIPQLMEEEETGIWAWPANNPVGGRHDYNTSPKKDSNNGNQEYCGTFMIPPSNSAVWIFFENGDSSRPYYFAAFDSAAKPAPPEMLKGSKPEERWLIFRSPQGRTIIISDDNDNCRIEITGKKNSITDPYTIKGNQKTILIEDGKNEKILISDQNGNYVNVNTNTNDINISSNNIVRVHATSAIYLDAPYIGISCDKIGIKSSGVDIITNGESRIGGSGKVSLTGSAVAFDAASVSSNCGEAEPPADFIPDPGTNSGDR